MLMTQGDSGKGAYCTYYSVARYIALVGATEHLLTCLLCWNRTLLFRETASPGVGHSRLAGGWYKFLETWTLMGSQAKPEDLRGFVRELVA